MRIDEPSALKALLQKHHLAVNKGLGQHFLCSRPVVDAIVHAAIGCHSVLEIGPGPGILSGPLSDVIPQVTVIELDARMQPVLAESAPKVELILGDALQISISGVLDRMGAPVGIVSNMPYYISAPLLQRVAELADSIDRAILMMQREVAERILAKAGNRDRGSLSVYLQAVFHIERLIHVPPGAFMPPPKVESTVLTFVPRRDAHDPKLFDFVRTGFAQPRKTLANNLGYLGRNRVTSAIETAGLSPTVRPHELTFEAWILLFLALKSSTAGSS